jgi:uncharacterized protein (TIGR03067 family)
MTPILVFLAWLFGADPAPKNDTVEQELARLEGPWKMIKLNLQDVDNRGKESESITFKRNKHILGLAAEATFEIDPSKNPKWIDIKSKSFDITMPGIYRFEGDELIIYIVTEFKSNVAPERPKDFDPTKKDAPAGQIWHFKRVK